jgi:hypothetical protein
MEAGIGLVSERHFHENILGAVSNVRSLKFRRPT